MLNVTVYTEDALADQSPSSSEQPTGYTFDNIDFVSLVNAETHGPPALVAPGRNAGPEGRPTARPGQTVLYINTRHVPLWMIERVGGDDV